MKRFTLAAFSVIVFLATSLLGQSNPVPFVNQPLVPTTVVPGSAAFTLTVKLGRKLERRPTGHRVRQ